MDSFQAGNLDVLICTYGVGATGITLTKSHKVILLDRPWTPGKLLVIIVGSLLYLLFNQDKIKVRVRVRVLC